MMSAWGAAGLVLAAALAAVAGDADAGEHPGSYNRKIVLIMVNPTAMAYLNIVYSVSNQLS